MRCAAGMAFLFAAVGAWAQPDVEQALDHAAERTASLAACLNQPSHAPGAARATPFCARPLPREALEAGDGPALSDVPTDLFYRFGFEDLYLCLAAARGEPRACEGLAWADRAMSLAGSKSWVHDCRNAWAQAALARALPAGRPAVAAACAAIASLPGTRDGPLARVCPELEQAPDDPESACRRAVSKGSAPGAHPADQARYCADLAGMLRGSARCATMEDSTERRVCDSLAAFAKARRSGASADCGGSALCRALLGEGPRACFAFADDARRSYCRSAPGDCSRVAAEAASSLAFAREALRGRSGPDADRAEALGKRLAALAALASRR